MHSFDFVFQVDCHYLSNHLQQLDEHDDHQQSAIQHLIDEVVTSAEQCCHVPVGTSATAKANIRMIQSVIENICMRT